MNNLYTFCWGFGRGGDIEGIFIATEEKVNRLIGKEVYFGEVLGKHSEVYGNIEEGEIKKLDVKQETVDDLLTSVGTTISGYNPFDYLDESD